MYTYVHVLTYFLHVHVCPRVRYGGDLQANAPSPHFLVLDSCLDDTSKPFFDRPF